LIRRPSLNAAKAHRDDSPTASDHGGRKAFAVERLAASFFKVLKFMPLLMAAEREHQGRIAPAR
jgi:hypothetical protein